jgi:autotransporter-associated beta strand protein
LPIFCWGVISDMITGLKANNRKHPIMKTNANPTPSQMLNHPTGKLFARYFFVFLSFFLTAQVYAANRTWIFSPTDQTWSNGANWGGTAPVPGSDAVIFGDSTITNLNNDLAANSVITGITFNNTTNSSYVFTNNVLNLGGNISDNSTQAQTINIGLNMTATRSANVINGGNLIIGGVVSQSAAGYGFSAAQASSGNATNLAFSTVTLNGPKVNAYNGTTTVGAGINLILEFSNLAAPVNLISNASAMTLSGGSLMVKGNPSASLSTFQTNGPLTLNAAGSGITLNPNGGAGTALTLGNTWTRSANSTLNVDVSAGGALYSNPTLNTNNGNGILAYATVKDATGTGFATTNASSQVVRNQNVTALPAGGTDYSTNYSTSGNTTMRAASFGVNSLTLDTTGTGGTLDLGGAGDVMTNNAILMTGANNYTIQNGQLGGANAEQIIHQMGPGTLAINGTIGSGTASLTKNGNGMLILNGASTYSGVTVINRGTVKAGGATIPGISGPLGNGNNQFVINAGGTLDLNGYNIGIGQDSAGNGTGSMITNSGTLATFTIGNNNTAKNGSLGNTLICGPIQLIVNGTGAGLSTSLFGNNTFSGGIIFTNNGGTTGVANRINSVGQYGTGPITFVNGGAIQNTSGTQNITNAFNILSTPGATANVTNYWNFQSTVNCSGPWTGTGMMYIDQGFAPTFTFAGDLTGFQGTLILAAGGTGGNNHDVFAFSNTNAIGGGQARWDLYSENGNAGSGAGVTLQWSGAAAAGNVTVPLGDLNTAAVEGGLPGAGTAVARNNVSGITATFQVGGLNLSSTFGGTLVDGSGPTAVIKVGTGTWTLSGANTYTGPTTISNGILVVAGSLGGSGAVTVNPGAALSASGSSVWIAGPVILDAGNAAINLTNNSGGTLNLYQGLTLSNANILTFDVGTASDQLAVNYGTFTQDGTATICIAPVAGFGKGTYNLITGASGITNASFTVGSAISGYSLSLTNPDAQTLALVVTVAAPSAAYWNNHVSTVWSDHNGSIYNWDTDLSAGINVGTVPSIPTDVFFAAGAASVFNTTLGADFNIRSLDLNTPNNVIIGGNNTLTLNAGIINDYMSSANVINTKIALGIDQTWVNNSPNSLMVNSNISGAYALTISDDGSGIVLNGVNTYSGGTVVSGGTLFLGNPTNTLADWGAVQVINYATLNLGANSDTVGAVTLTSGTITGTSGVLTGSSYNVENGTVSANLGGPAALTKIGQGETVLLSGNNTFSGGVLITGGTLQPGSANALGTGSITVNGGVLDLNGQSISNAIAMMKGVGDGNSALANNSATPAALLTGWSSASSFAIGGSGDITVPAMSAGGVWTVTVNSGGTVTFGGAGDNSYMGLVVNYGNVILGKTNIGGYHVVGGNISSGSDLVLNYGTVQFAAGGNGDQLYDNRTITINLGTLDLNGQSEAVDGLNGTGGSVINSSNTVGTLTLGVVNGNGVQVYSGAISGPVAITKGSASLQDFNGANTYSGNTTIGAGILVLEGAASASPNSTYFVNVTNGLQFINDTAFALGGLGGTQGFALADTNGNAIALTVGGDNGSATNSGVITGPGSLTKVGNGTLTLSGADGWSFTGLTTVNAGTLALSSSQTNTLPITVNDGAGFSVIVSGTNQMAPSILTLGSSIGATNTFIGVNNTNIAPVNVPTLNLVGVSVIKVSSLQLISGRTYPLIGYGSKTGAGSVTLGALPIGVQGSLTDNGSVISLAVTSVAPEIWTGAANGTWDTTAVDWSVAASATNYVDGAVVLFNDAATGTTAITNIVVVAPASITVSNSSKPYSFTGGAISGSATLTKNGNGLLILASTNTYSGGTTLSNGTLQLGDGVANDGVVAGGITDNANLIFANPMDQTYAGVISGTGTLMKTNAGALTLTGANTFTGNLTINGGTLTNGTVPASGTGISSPLGNLAVVRNININNGGTLNLTINDALVNGNSPLNATFVVNAGGKLTSSRFNQIGAVTLNGGILENALGTTGDVNYDGWTLLGSVTVGGSTASAITTVNGRMDCLSTGSTFNVADVTGDAGADLIVSAPLGDRFSGGGAGGITKTGVGTMLLSGTNSYTGSTTINAGTLALSGDGSIANTADITIGSGAALDVSGLTSLFALGSGQTLAGSSGTGTIAGSMDLNAGSLVLNYASGTPTLNVQNGALSFNRNPVTVTVSGAPLPAGSYKLIAAGTGGSVAGTVPASVTVNGAGAVAGSTLQITSGELYLVVASAVNLTPTNLVATVTGGNLTLTWPADHTGWTLQAQTNALSTGLGTNWVNVADSATTNQVAVPVSPANGSVFFRLVYP